MSKKLIDSHIMICNPDCNGGENLVIKTNFYDNGDEENNIFINQEITLHSYGNSCSFNLCGSPLTVEVLRELANKIEAKLNKLQK